MRGSSIGWKERAGAGPSWSAPPSTSATGWIRSNPRKDSAGCSRRPISRSIRSPTVTWPRVSSPPAVRWHRWSTATARPTPRSCTRAASTGWRSARRAPAATKSLRCNRRRRRRGPGVVAVEPIRVGGVAHPGAGAGPGLHHGRPRLARRLVEPERVCDVIELGDAAREHGGVFERHRGAGRHVGGHRMTGIAEQDDAALAPGRKRITLEDAPLVDLGRRVQHRPHVGMEIRKRRAHLAEVAFRGPGLLGDPIRLLGLAGGEIDLVTCRGDEVDDDVPVRSPPLGARGSDLDAAQPRGGKRGAIGEPPDEARLLRPRDGVADERVHAVGADHRLGLDLAAVGEAELGAGSARLDGDKLLAEVHAVAGHDGRQRLVQVAAMEREIGRAVTLLELAPEWMIVGHLAGGGVAVERGCRVKRDLAQAILDPQSTQYAHGVGTLLDACAHPRELVGLLVDVHSDAAAAQRRRGREAADAGADDGDGTHGISHGRCPLYSSGILAALITPRQCGISFWMWARNASGVPV